MRATGGRAVGFALAVLLAAGRVLCAQTVVSDSGARSVRSAALGGAGVALVGDAASLFANPAAIATIRRGALEASYEHRATGANVFTGAAALRVGRFDWGVAGSATGLDAGGNASDALGLSALVFRYGMLAVGGTVKYVQQLRDSAKVYAWAGDVGLELAAFDIAALGASVQNISGDFGDGTHLRRLTRVGLTMNYVDPQGSFRLLTTFEGQWPEERASILVVGVEAGVVTRGIGVIGRVGTAGRSEPQGGAPVTLGGGIELRELHLDYAYQSSSSPGGSRHRFGFRWTH